LYVGQRLQNFREFRPCQKLSSVSLGVMEAMPKLHGSGN
jgi:hypothetical protein